MKEEKDEFEDVLIDIGDGGQFGRIMKKVRVKKQSPDHCCDWTGSETCPGCKYEASKRKK